MNTIINTAKFKADEKLEKYINDKVGKLDRMTDRATKCEVFLKPNCSWRCPARHCSSASRPTPSSRLSARPLTP